MYSNTFKVSEGKFKPRVLNKIESTEQNISHSREMMRAGCDLEVNRTDHNLGCRV